MTSQKRSALVTGASRGIGRAIALDLASQGYALTVTSRSDEDLASLAVELDRAGATHVQYRAADLADSAARPALIDDHVRSHGMLDALVLSGGVGTFGPLELMSTDRIDKTISVNFCAAVDLIRVALPLLQSASASHGCARIVLLSSLVGHYAQAGLAVYGATKAALISLAESVNAEVSSRGVMATAVAPAYVNTDMSAWVTESIPADSMIPTSDVVAVVRMVLGLDRNTSITRVLISRSGTSGHIA